MKNISTKTKKPAAEVIQRAKEFFKERFCLSIRNESSDRRTEFANDLAFAIVDVNNEQGSSNHTDYKRVEYQI